MKRLICFALLTLFAAGPAWAAKKMTVDELKQTLASLNQLKKTDEEVATRLKEVELSEELTRSARAGMMAYVPGPLSEEQMNVIEGRSAILAPRLLICRRLRRPTRQRRRRFSPRPPPT